MANLRRSVRIKSQGNEAVPMLAKAQGRVQSKYNLRSVAKCISLLSSFPYSRLTEEKVSSLFKAHNIRLGIDTLQYVDIIRAIKNLDYQHLTNL